MVKFSRKITITFLLLCGSLLSGVANAQTFTIDPDNDVIDPIWGNYAPIPANNTQPGEYVETGEPGDIVGIKFVAEMPNPSKIYFQVDGYDVLDIISMKLDCDGDGLFNSQIDRQIYFVDISETGEGGEIEGEIDYTEEFLDIADEEDLIAESSSFAIGEFVVKGTNEAEGTTLQSFEALFDLEEDDSNILAPCFGPAMNDSWKINYQFDTGEDGERTFVVPLQVDVTSVTMGQQSAESFKSTNRYAFAIMFLVLGAMTISLLYGYGYRKRKTV